MGNPLKGKSVGPGPGRVDFFNCYFILVLGKLKSLGLLQTLIFFLCLVLSYSSFHMLVWVRIRICVSVLDKCFGKVYFALSPDIIIKST